MAGPDSSKYITTDDGTRPADPVAVDIDHPFILLIRDIETGTILFVGRVLDPGV